MTTLRDEADGALPSLEVVCLGEALVDFVPEKSRPGSFLARAGGAPANVAAGLARLDRRAAFLGRVGADPLGAMVVDALAAAGVDLRWLQRDPVRPTSVAVVSGADAGPDRFTIYHRGTADGALELGEPERRLIAGARVLHLGTLSLSGDGARAATLEAVEIARVAGVAISVDVNLRPSAWSDPDRMVGEARDLLGATTLAKLTRAELAALDVRPADLLDVGVRVLLVTDGPREALVVTPQGAWRARPPAASVVDETAGGDAFVAAFLACLLQGWGGSPDAVPSPTLVREALVDAVTAGSIAVTRPGGIESLPDAAELAAARQAVARPDDRPGDPAVS